VHSHLSCEVHHDKEQGFEKCELVLQHPDERQSLHQKFDGHHTTKLSVPGLLITAGAQTLNDVGEQRQLACLGDVKASVMKFPSTDNTHVN